MPAPRLSIAMGRTIPLHCDEAMAREIADLARDYGITEHEVVRQLVEIGLEELERLEHA